jgi:hypothetical protein
LQQFTLTVYPWMYSRTQKSNMKKKEEEEEEEE